MKAYIQNPLLFLFVITIIAALGCERDKIVVEHQKDYIWVEEYTAFPAPLFPHDSLLIVDSVICPGKIKGEIAISNDDPIPVKSVLVLDMYRLLFQVEIFRDDTVLVSKCIGHCDLIDDTLRLNVGDSIIQDYGLIMLSPDAMRLYDFKWPNSNGVTIINIPHNYILWWEYAMKSQGVFIRQEIRE